MFTTDPFTASFGTVLQGILQPPNRPGTFTLRNHGQEYDEDGEPLPMPPPRTHTLLPILDDLWPGPRHPRGPVVHPRLYDRDVDRALLALHTGQLDLQTPGTAVQALGPRRMRPAHPNRTGRPKRPRRDIDDGKPLELDKHSPRIPREDDQSAPQLPRYSEIEWAALHAGATIHRGRLHENGPAVHEIHWPGGGVTDLLANSPLNRIFTAYMLWDTLPENFEAYFEPPADDPP